MLKILPTGTIKALDAYTIEQGSIASIDLMERACRAFVSWFVEKFDSTHAIGIVCGTGNNGGDGLGIARLLHEHGYGVKIWVVKGTVSESIDFRLNLDNARAIKLEIVELADESDERFPFADRDVLIDGLFGSGLTRPLTGIYARVIEYINNANATRVAIDIPSGLMADSPSVGAIVKADFTVSFQLPKLAFMFPENYSVVGDWAVVDIGLNKDFIKKAETEHFYLIPKDPRRILKKRSKFDHKGVYGHVLIVAGSKGKMGAAILASQAALRSGPGLLSIHVPKCGYQIIQTAVPEAMATVDQHDDYFTDEIDLKNFSAIGIGPGLGNSGETIKAYGDLLKHWGKPMVIDADGLNIMAENKELLQLVPAGSILTPHPKEFERMVGKWQNDFERMDKQKELAKRLKSVVVLKGANSAIASPEGKVCFNSTGNPGMATGGAGDVLTGILTGLLAQGYDCFQAAILGVYLHGLSGDLAVLEYGMNSLIASDLVNFLPSAFLRLHRE
jgi:ADP-dependent NAD(P)H-hydrate dehydratase / NAD(P)H-hydrate epimerase